MSKGHISIQTDNDLKYIDPRETHLRNDIDGATGLQLKIEPAPPVVRTTKDNQSEYKLLFIIPQAYLINLKYFMGPINMGRNIADNIYTYHIDKLI